MKKWPIAIFIVSVSAILFFLWGVDEQELGDNYYYLPKYEAIDIGYPGAIIYKSTRKNIFEEVKIEGDVIRVSNNKEFILALQKPYTIDIEKEPFDSSTIKSLKYFIVSKKSEIVYGPYAKKEYLQKKVELGVPKDLRLNKWE